MQEEVDVLQCSHKVLAKVALVLMLLYVLWFVYAELKALDELVQMQCESVERAFEMQDAEIAWLKAEIAWLKAENAELRTIPACVASYAPLDPKSVDGFDYSGDPSVTATGVRVSRGLCAADFRRIPAGTVLYIPNYGEARVEDTGSMLRNSNKIMIDVVMDTREEALQWGRQDLEVTVLSVGGK